MSYGGSTGSNATSTGSSAGTSDAGNDPCGVNPTDRLGLRIGAVFIILLTSLFGTLFPVVTRRVTKLRNAVPGIVFEFAKQVSSFFSAKFFGSGVILATSLVHLLEPAADDELGPANTIALGGCISNSWVNYPYAFGICLASLFFTFVLELVAFRLGTKYLAARGITMEGSPSGPGVHGAAGFNGVDSAHGGHVIGGNDMQGMSRSPMTDPQIQTEKAMIEINKSSSLSVDETYTDASEDKPAAAQILGVAILEFGVVFHSLIIGLTLSLSSPDEFTTLFIVIIFHQMFEGLGLGTRLAFLKLPGNWAFAPFAGAVIYSFVTPLGMAIGLGTRESTSMTSANASIAAGVLDSISAGILIYTATVELIAHEFIFNAYYHTCSWKKLTFVVTSFMLGAGIMALLVGDGSSVEY
ncbi:MAG: high-affinity Zn(2+) transporter zrt1 [Tremellales sp. Tagirdzhanova-0007]|nr:MAG: high-affinity Zn(2+) transporter zrt1 [Tremellales sp. Tagirdzhanova-0007]